jgi:transcriptional regulator with XRE-family HTH domain
MDFSEKLLTLRKAKNLTQEQLAEKLEVSRQSVSKWESGQAVPELEKIIALSAVFDVTTDYLLKSSEIDDLSVKTELLEKQQQRMLERERQQKRIWRGVLSSIAVYLIFFAVCFAEHYFYFSHDMGIWGKPIVLAEFLIATAVVTCLWPCKTGKGAK